MNVRMVQTGEKKLVGLRVVGRRQELSHRVPLAWMQLVAALDGIDNRVDDGVFYGVFVEADHAGDGHYRYWVTAEVSSFGEKPEGMVELTVPAGSFAMVTIEGGPERIDEAYLALARAIAGKGAAGDYGFERYEASRQAPVPPYARFDYDVYRPAPPAHAE